MKKKAIFMSLNAFRNLLGSAKLEITQNEDKGTLFVIDKTSELTYRCQQSLDPNADMAWLIPVEEFPNRKDAIANACLVNVNRTGNGANLKVVGTI